MTTYTATAANGQTATRSSKTVVYTHARAYTFPDGSVSFTFHKSERAALTGAHPHPSWSNLPREVVPTTTDDAADLDEFANELADALGL